MARSERRLDRTEPKPPQPPPRYDLGPCAQCIEEGGIVIHGSRRPPQAAVIHPLHTGGPSAPLCSWHLQLLAWKHGGSGYPKPQWAREGGA